MSKKVIQKKGLLVLVLIFVIMFILNTLTPLLSDDYYSAFLWPQGMRINDTSHEAIKRISGFEDIFRGIKGYYYTWGGRVPGGLPVSFFVWQGKEFFNPINALMMSILAAEIYWLSHEGKVSVDFNPSYLIWIFFALWAFNASFVDTCLWLAGASNYLWMLVLVLAFLIPYIRSYFDINAFNTLATNNKTGYSAKKLGDSVYNISFPVAGNVLVDCYEALNASQLRFVFTKTETMQPQQAGPEIKLEVQQPTSKSSEAGKKQVDLKKENPIANLLERQKKSSKNKKQKVAPGLERIKDKMIILDPGHGGNDTGALRGSVLEKDITLQIALKVRDCLREKGLTKIVMTRTSDTTLTLDDRVQTSNNYNADIFVSIHINASVKSEIKGIETHYYTENGYEVAKIIHQELIDNVDAMDRGLFKSKFYVINHTEAPAVLLELGFISNDSERNALLSEQRQTDSAQAIADGIVKYLLEH